MPKIIIPLNEVKEGMKVASNIYNSDDKRIVDIGTVITKDIIETLKRNSITTVSVMELLDLKKENTVNTSGDGKKAVLRGVMEEDGKKILKIDSQEVVKRQEATIEKTKSLYERVNQTEGNGEKVVMYFAGCYASFIKPEIGESTINVLKKLGYKVVTPAQHCCGIPHLSKGLAKDTRSQIKKNLKEWGSLIDQVDYIVSACSSCTLSLTKEWLYYQNDEITQKIRDKTIFIMDLVEKHIDEVEVIENNISLGYHKPCHMKLLKNPASTQNVLKKLNGVTVDDLKSGCCGMAGSWGMSAKNYDLSIKIGIYVLLLPLITHVS